MHSRSQPAGAAALTDRVEMDAVGSMKIRKPYALCSTVGSDCSQSHCCKVTNTYCWKTDTGGGQCEIKSKPGWPGQELEGTDTIVSVDSANIGNSLFCFSSTGRTRAPMMPTTRRWTCSRPRTSSAKASSLATPGGYSQTPSSTWVITRS